MDNIKGHMICISSTVKWFKLYALVWVLLASF